MEENKHSEIHITSRLEIDRLHLHPNKHLILQALQKYNPPFEPEYYNYNNVEVSRTKFLDLNEIQVFKTNFLCDLTCTKNPENEHRIEIKSVLLVLS